MQKTHTEKSPWMQQVLKLPRNAIDTRKWDSCLNRSINETPVAYSRVLDQLSQGWEGIIIGDYEGIMPLPVTKRGGFKLIQMPQEVTTLGLFSENPGITGLFPEIFNHPCFSEFRFISYNGHPGTTENPEIPGTFNKKTYELNLNKPYEELYRAYSRSHRRSIKAFYESHLSINSEPFPAAYTTLLAEIGKKRPELMMPRNYRKKFATMTEEALKNTDSSTYSIRHNGRLIGASFFFKTKNRTIPYHMANEVGRKFKTSFALIDHFIKEHAETNTVLDFAGSVIPKVAEFNKRFGAEEVPYCTLYFNKLPLFLKTIKEANPLLLLKRMFQ